METIYKLKSYTGDGAQFSAKGAADLSEAIVTFLDGKTYAGGDEYSNITTGIADPGLTTVSTANPFNDVDVKCHLVFKDRSDPANIKQLRVTIPAPIIDVAGGIATQLSDEKRIVPKTKAVGANGDDGDTLAGLVATMLGMAAGDVEFSSGTFSKRPQ